MNSLIEKIWREEYKPSEKHVLYGEEITHSARLLDAKEKELWDRLNEENRKLFDEIIGIYYDMVDYYKLDAYTQGIHFVGNLLKEIINTN